MIFSTHYRRPFWHGFFHAVLVLVYVLFLSLILLSLQQLFQGEIGMLIQIAFYLFLIVLSIGVLGWLIFFEPLKHVFRHRFKTATVMMASIIGWMFVFLVIFLFGLVWTLA